MPLPKEKCIENLPFLRELVTRNGYEKATVQLWITRIRFI